MSKRSSKWNIWSITFLALLIIGIVYSVIRNPFVFIIPIVVLGGIFLLYKYPPSFLRGMGTQQGSSYAKAAQRRSTTTNKKKTNKPRSKTVPFRVIEGGKEDDDTPKYH